MCVISVVNYLLSIFILWGGGGGVECRICKWKLLSVNRLLLLPLLSLPRLGVRGLVFYILLQ